MIKLFSMEWESLDDKTCFIESSNPKLIGTFQTLQGLMRHFRNTLGNGTLTIHDSTGEKSYEWNGETYHTVSYGDSGDHAIVLS